MTDIYSSSIVTSENAFTGTQSDTLFLSIKWLTEYHGKFSSIAALFHGLPRDKKLSPSLAVKMLDQTGISAAWVKRSLNDISEYLLPVVVARKNGEYYILKSKSSVQQEAYELLLPETGGVLTVSLTELQNEYAGYILLNNRNVTDEEGSDHNLLPDIDREGHWLFSTLWRYRYYFYNAAIAALLANILTLATTFFTMNVYDRVVPNQAYITLWSMAIGVVIAILFEFTSRQIRAWLIDIAGKKADLVIGARLFRQMMAVRLEFKPQSAGSFANQLREFESVRDFITSATLSTLSDIPFCALFLFIIYLIGGQLAFVPLFAVPVILLFSILVQRPLSRCMQENMRETSLKHGLLIESIEGIETLKAVHGEGVMQKRWEDFSALSSRSTVKIRHFSSMIVSFTTFVQQMTTVIIVVWGVYLIHSGELTMGSLIGVVLLTGRALSPLAALVGLAIRYQQAKTALKSLNQLMALPVERESARDYIPATGFTGNITLEKINFNYPIPGTKNAVKAIKDATFHLPAGSKTGIIGTIGSGKSTLLKVIARLYQPQDGQILIDGIDANQIDLADWRNIVGYVGQDCRLFQGTMRENVMLGNPSAHSEHFIRVAKLTGLDLIAANHPMGFDMPVGEMGQLLSGGQRQLVALARCLLLDPKIILLDEPTSSMDALSEQKFITQLQRVITTQTLIIVTHRFSLLHLVDTLLVITDGKITHNGSKEAVLAEIKSAKIRGESN